MVGHHDHAHDHHHSHHAPKQFNKAFAIAIFLNFGFTIIEAVYAVLANSMSLLADAGHNLGDVLGLLFAWVANVLITKKATERFSYGLKKTSIIAALTNALILVATSAIIAYESILKLVYPQSVNELVVIFVALIGIFVNGGTAALFMRGRKGDLNIQGAFLHLAYDALISLGVVLAATLIYFTGWERIDPVVGILIVIAILAGTWGLLRDSINLILDAVPRQIDQQAVRDYLKKIPGVVDIHDLHIWGLSTNEIALTAHLIMPEVELTDADYVRINDEFHDLFHINHVTLQVEKGTAADPCGQGIACT